MKQKNTKKKKIEGIRPETPTERPQGAAPAPPPVPNKPEIEDLNGLPNRDLFRINEVADYFSVSERTIRLWIEHGHFQIEKLRGTIWVPRTSILKFRIKTRVVWRNKRHYFTLFYTNFQLLYIPTAKILYIPIFKNT